MVQKMVILAFLSMLFRIILLAQAQDQGITTSDLKPYSSERKTMWANSRTKLQKRILSVPVNPDICDSVSTCENDDPCKAAHLTCRCDLSEHTCYVLDPCMFQPCIDDDGCDDVDDQPCRCPDGGGLCYDEALPPEAYSA